MGIMGIMGIMDAMDSMIRISNQMEKLMEIGVCLCMKKCFRSWI
uniref:Uncharacterized protein n=1 Tax=Candidatus Nitrotoga fabula TaxID=2182327 RepID=A0A2X0QTE6_9PROT|nr:protein of unknown function [Candidatus Nitrotoga fabula]